MTTSSQALGHITRDRGSSRVEAPASADPARGPDVTTQPDYRFLTLRPAEMTPAERAAAVATILAAGLLRLLRPEHFPTTAAGANSQEFAGESTC